MITNIQHFLDENGEIPALTPEAEELLNFLGKVVEAATIDYGRPLSLLRLNAEDQITNVVPRKLRFGLIQKAIKLGGSV